MPGVGLGKGGDFSGGQTGIPSFDKGGSVRKTELAIVHQGERVLTKPQARKVLKIMRAKAT